MILIEFYSKLSINNIITSLYNDVDRVIFLGYPPAMVEPYVSRIADFIKGCRENDPGLFPLTLRAEMS